jgi:hypothetical protein
MELWSLGADVSARVGKWRVGDRKWGFLGLPLFWIRTRWLMLSGQALFEPFVSGSDPDLRVQSDRLRGVFLAALGADETPI